MGRPRKPTALLELSGAFRENPNRRRPNEPVDTREIGDPPRRLPPKAEAFWLELTEMVAGGVLTYRDRWAVELAARLMEKAVRIPSIAIEREIAAKLSPAEAKALLLREAISSSELSILRSLLASFGMTPADRSKLSVPTQKPKNRFAQLAEEANRRRT
jgi:phage terminase small subunit